MKMLPRINTSAALPGCDPLPGTGVQPQRLTRYWPIGQTSGFSGGLVKNAEWVTGKWKEPLLAVIALAGGIIFYHPPLKQTAENKEEQKRRIRLSIVGKLCFFATQLQ